MTYPRPQEAHNALRGLIYLVRFEPVGPRAWWAQGGPRARINGDGAGFVLDAIEG